MVVYISTKRVFDISSNNIFLPTTKVLLRAAVGKFAHSKKLRNWVMLNAILLPPFLTEDVIMDSQAS